MIKIIKTAIYGFFPKLREELQEKQVVLGEGKRINMIKKNEEVAMKKK